MADKIKTVKKVFEVLNEIENVVNLKLIEEEPTFTGKITIDINCNQGGISGVEIYTKRKIISKIDKKVWQTE